MKMIANLVPGLALLLLLQFSGDLISSFFSLPIPGNVIGMVLLWLLLRVGLVRPQWVEAVAELLLSHLALFFVPAGVGVMIYWELIGREWLPICVGTFVSTFVVLSVTGRLAQRLENKQAGEG